MKAQAITFHRQEVLKAISEIEKAYSRNVSSEPRRVSRTNIIS